MTRHHARAAFSAAVLSAALLVQPPTARPAAPRQRVLVELFTSEGCSSCPPADRLLAELEQKQPVAGAAILVLSEHVDYWNSLGWRDPYSSHFWSERQDAYARRFGLDSVYTPQMVVGGMYQMVGSDARAVRAAIQDALKRSAVPIEISAVSMENGKLRVTYSSGASPGADLYTVIADDADRSSVRRGENAGRTLDHVAVAQSLARIAGMQTASADKTVEIEIPPGGQNQHLRLILFAQDAKSGRIAGAAQRELPQGGK